MKILHGSADTEDARPGITEAERAQHVATCRANVVESIAAVLEVGRTHHTLTWSPAAAVQGWAGLGVPLPQHLSEAGQRVRKAVESVTSVTSSSVTSSSVTSSSVTGAGAELTASVYSPHLARDVASLWAEARLQAAAARLSQVGGVEEDCY